MNRMSLQGEEDRLSSLSDDILIHILSFLPTKGSIVSSILSKRWIHLWRHVPVLNFLDTEVISQQDNDHFIQFIKTNFLSPEVSAASRSIHTFFLGIQFNPFILDYHDIQISLSYINNWVKHVVEHNNVQYLSVYDRCRLPISIFRCKTLVVLKLSGFYMDQFSPFPLIRLPSLKTLNLKYVYFDQCQDFMLLLDGCPVLEDLQASYIYFNNPFRRFDFEQFENSSLRKLNRADITRCYFHFPLKALSNLELLRIDIYRGYHPNGFPTFHNLTHLVVNCDCDLAVQVLQHCPKLQNLKLYPKSAYGWIDAYISYITKDDQENRTDLEIIPHCLSLSLTTCTIRDHKFTMLESLIMLARFILKNARVLETMTIWGNGKRLSEIERKLSSCPRASATSQLSFRNSDNLDMIYK